MTLLVARRWLRGLRLTVLAAVPSFQACTQEILKVEDADIILEANSPSSALALAKGTIFRLTQAVSGTEGADNLFMFGGLVADEWRSGDTFVQRNNADQRIFEPENTFHEGLYRNLNRVRVQAQVARKGLRAFVPDDATGIARMFALEAYAEVLIGEHYCNGTPLSTVDIASGAVLPGTPITNDSVFTRAIAHADSALALTNDAEVAPLASVVKGRALLDRGLPAAARSAVVGVAEDFKWVVEHSIITLDNELWGLNNSPKRYTMVDREGGNGLDFISANDPRLPRYTGPDQIFDSSFPLPVTRQGIYGEESDVPIATGIEARLIEAEANLAAGTTAAWLATINGLRTDTTLYPPVGAGTVIPATPDSGSRRFTRGAPLTAIADTFADNRSRVYTHFRERAFWMFTTGHRLGDMRRLIRQYSALGFAEANVFPVGSYLKGGTYGLAVNLPVPIQEQNNANFEQCIDVNP